MRLFKFTFLLVIACAMLTGCEKINNKSLPGFSVRINLGDYGRWNTYGVHALGEYRVFNRVKGLPSNFPYDVNTYTGFGGVLLFMGQDMRTLEPVPFAFDMACPVEHDVNVTITIDPDNLDAVCPKCKSRYDVEFQGGRAVSGMAVTRNKGMNAYHVRFVSDRAQYMNYGCTIVN